MSEGFGSGLTWWVENGAFGVGSGLFWDDALQTENFVEAQTLLSVEQETL